MTALRTEFHRKLCAALLGLREGGYVNVADKSNAGSRDIAERMANKLPFPMRPDPPDAGQAAGTIFSNLVAEFLKDAFRLLQHVRPGDWRFSTSHGAIGIAAFDQYEHLATLSTALAQYRELAAALGGDYLITPDIVVARKPLTDSELNAGPSAPVPLVGKRESAAYTPLRSNNTGGRLILHASISCKWTMRSDRAQNTRTEALNLIRNRKGNAPHIVCVTMEPLPTRIASIAMGTGDIDCTYHGALHELCTATAESGREDQLDILTTLIEGRRLRDISDMPFDLAI